MDNEARREAYRQYYAKWHEVWSKQSEEVLMATALVRAMECTNGCVQYAMRGNDPGALSIEDTRVAMKTSMSAIKTKVLDIPGEEPMVFPEDAQPLMEEAREYYQKMKTGDDDAYNQFYALSTAHFHVLGEDRMEQAFEYFRYHFTDIFTEKFIYAGEDYIWWVAGF